MESVGGARVIYNFSEDQLVQQTMADYLEQELGWRSVYAYNQEDYGCLLYTSPSPRD